MGQGCMSIAGDGRTREQRFPGGLEYEELHPCPLRPIIAIPILKHGWYNTWNHRLPTPVVALLTIKLHNLFRLAKITELPKENLCLPDLQAAEQRNFLRKAVCCVSISLKKSGNQPTIALFK